MKSRLQLAILLATSALAFPAAAQTGANPKPNQPASSMPTSGAPAAKPTAERPVGSGQAMTSADASQIRYVTQNRRDLWRASKLEGLDVYNDRNEKIGDITEVLVDRQGKVEAVVIGVGGFLGMGQRDVAVSFDQLRWQMSERANTAATSAPSSRDATTTGSTSAAGTSAAGTTGSAPAPTGTTMAGKPAAPRSDGGLADSRYDQNRDYPARAVLAGASKDQLKNAPEFQYAK